MPKLGLIRWGREVTGALHCGTEISKGIREQEPNPVLDVEKTSAKSQRIFPSCSIANVIQSGPLRSKATAHSCAGSRFQTRKNAACCSGVKHSSKAGEGEAVAATRGESRNGKDRRRCRWVREKAGSSAVVLQEGQRSAHEWGAGDCEDVADSEDVAGLEIYNSNEGKGLSPGGVKVFLN